MACVTGQKITYLIDINRLVGATRISDSPANTILSNQNHEYDMTLWTVSTDGIVLSLNAQTLNFVNTDEDFFCFICY